MHGRGEEAWRFGVNPNPTLTASMFARSPNHRSSSMTPRRMIVYMGAPLKADLMRTWTGGPPSPTQDIPNLRPFQVDPQLKTEGVAWRRLGDPVDSLSQELADTTMDLRSPEDLFLERSLRIFNNDIDDQDEMDDYESPEDSNWSISQMSPPFPTGYDFDMNEITELEELPSININLQRNYSVIVAITEISPTQTITTKYGKTIPLVKLIVADQTRSNLEIACWETMALLAQSLRTHDIIYFRGITTHHIANGDLGLSQFRGVVSAATRRRSRAIVLYRCRRLSRADDALRPRLDLEDQQTRMVRRLRDWIMRSNVGRDVPPTLETQD
jgi:hypothetical protein